jgi:hypothetical protein
MMTSLVSCLKAAGFAPLTRSVYWCRAGELIHAVVISKDRYGEIAISPIVWHSALIRPDEEFKPSSVQSPVCGSVGPSGINSSWTWKTTELDSAFLVSTLKVFFGRFATLQDLRRSLQGTYVTPFFQERLEQGAARPEIDALVTTSAIYAVTGGAIDRIAAHSVAAAFLSNILSLSGFSLAQTEDVVVIRARGEMFDCVRLVLDQFGTFASVVCFPWTTKIWKIDNRWKGTYYPMIPRDVCKNGRPILLDLSQLGQVDIADLHSGIQRCLAQIQAISDARTFADQMDPQWRTIANALRKIS